MSFASDEKPANVKARAMLRMVDQINKTSLPQLTRRHTLDVEAIHRDHGIVEQVIAELKSGPLAHLPSGVFTANAAWLACAGIAHGLTRAAAALAGGGHARTRTHQAATPIERCVARPVFSVRRDRHAEPRQRPWWCGRHIRRVTCQCLPVGVHGPCP